MYSSVINCLLFSRTTARLAALLSCVCIPAQYFSSPALLHFQKDATHIFDGLDDFPTHIAHMRLGSLVTEPSPWPITQESVLAAQFPPATTLFKVALQWLRKDKDYREALEKQGIKKTRGARRNEVIYSILLLPRSALISLLDCATRL